MIEDIHNNYRYLSFNFGPTLFGWIEREHPSLAASIVEADRQSCLRLEGHGNALAQAYNHIILPLASRRDQLTQIRWGKAYFRSRFGREPEGMWLSETAINAETVRCLIEEGIGFVVLAPTQADAIRRIGGDDNAWEFNGDSTIDTRRAYRIWLPDGEGAGGHLDAFFFDEGLSRGASFGTLLNNAGALGGALRGCHDGTAEEARVAILATDGETFGHHKPYGDMCLAYLYSRLASQMGLTPVSFGYFRAKHPPRYEVRLRNADADGCAWSCAHGTGRWARDCGCSTGGYPEWNQRWRTPLRRALDQLQVRLNRAYERYLAGKVDDPWRLRDEYVLLKDRIEYDTIRELLTAHGAGVHHSTACERAQRLLAAQAYMLYAYTSCGWFFADISGLETVQNLQYACRAAQLGLEGRERERAIEEFTGILDTAASNLDGQTGKTIFETHALPNLRSAEILAFAAAATASHRDAEVHQVVEGYDTIVRGGDGAAKGARRKGIRRCEVTVKNVRTGEHETFDVVLAGRSVLRLQATVTPVKGGKYRRSVELTPADLFVASRRKLTGTVIRTLLKRIDTVYRPWTEENEESIAALVSLEVPLPAPLLCPVSHGLNDEWARLMAGLEEPGREGDIFTALLPVWKRARSLGVSLESSRAGRRIDKRLRHEIASLTERLDETACERVRTLLNIAERFRIDLSRSGIEDAFYALLNGPVTSLYRRYAQGTIGDEWAMLLCVLSLARRLNFSTARFPLTT
jgi:hypothetical protein